MILKKMSGTWVFPYLPFSYLGTIPIKKIEKIGCLRWGRSPNRSDFQFLVPAGFVFNVPLSIICKKEIKVE